MNTTDTYQFRRSIPFHIQGWGGSSPDAIVREFVADAALELGGMLRWSASIRCRPVTLRDDQDRDRILRVCAGLPARMRSMMPPAMAYAVCARRIRSGRPWRVEWAIPVCPLYPPDARFEGIELYQREVLALK